MTGYDAIIVGCGLAGATCARLLAEYGKKVLIIEQRKNIGGQIFDYKNESGITVQKYGPHIFHTNHKYVWDFVNRFAGFSNYQHRVLSFANGNYVNFPINRHTLNDIFGENLANEEVFDFLRKEVENSIFTTPATNFRDAIVSQVGERLYSLFFENYTKKQWDCSPECLSPELAGRIPVRDNNDDRYFTDKYQGMPISGFTEMIRKMVDHEHIHMLLGCDYLTIREQLSADLTIYTGELDKYFGFKYGKLAYRSVRIELKTIEQKEFQPGPVVNYPNDYDFTRITEFKKLTGEKSHYTTICYEYPSPDGIPFYTVPDRANQQLREKYMEEVRKLESSERFLFVGRLAEYKYYDMDAVIDSAMKCVEKWKMNS